MTNTDIAAMEWDLERFHKLKGLLVTKGMYKTSEQFDKIPKLHMLSHYVFMIQELGTPDGFNTELPEHLHIEYAKEAIRIHWSYMDLYLGLDPDKDDKDDNIFNPGDVNEGEDTAKVIGLHSNKAGGEGMPEAITYPNPRRQMAKNPTKQNVPISAVISNYSASIRQKLW
ncbi:hypothetical protein FRC10_010101, partial [Ceratobasidium sp. 414]